MINNLVSAELKKIEENVKYLNATRIINELQNEVLNNISKEVNEYIKPFIELNSFKIINNYERQRINTPKLQ